MPLTPVLPQRRPPLFGLAPGGVYPAAPVARGAVRSCRTVSPLPSRLRALAVCFLWHFPWGRPRRPLAGTVFPWSPDFPPGLPPAVVQPSGAHGLAWVAQASKQFFFEKKNQKTFVIAVADLMDKSFLFFFSKKKALLPVPPIRGQIRLVTKLVSNI